MPTYEYQCGACEAVFEREQRITEKPIKKCAKCGANKARRLITQGNFILKGGGWYSDAYSGPSNKKSTGSSSDSGSEGAPKGAEGAQGERSGADATGDAKSEGGASAGGKSADGKSASGKSADGKSAGGKSAGGGKSTKPSK